MIEIRAATSADMKIANQFSQLCRADRRFVETERFVHCRLALEMET